MLVVAILVALSATMSPALNGCASDPPAVSHVAEAGVTDARRSAETASSDELSRFSALFNAYASDPNNTRQLKHFRDAIKRIRSAYVEDVPEAKLIDAAVQGVRAKNPTPGSMTANQLVETALDAVTASLDPHSAYLNPEELRESEMVTSGEFGGLGIQVTQEEGRIKVISPIEGTPADRAGIKPGDIIDGIDGRPVEGMTLRDAVNAMRGEPGSRIKLTIQRDGKPQFDVAITRAIITIEPLRWRTEGNIGYLRIVSFNEKVADGVEKAIEEMRNSTHNKLQGVVIDLRNNPGGLLDQSLAVSDEFLDSGVIVSIRGREVGSDRTFRAERGDLVRGLPIVVLINAGSASASEIVAAALQDHHRATVIGTRSFGKGSVQTVMRLPVEGALKLTTALYYAPSGEAIQARGVIPDIAITGEDNPPGDIAHESDLPGALPARGEAQHSSQGSVDASACPAIGDNGDRELGCAISLLQAGSADGFLASLGARTRL
jgi:carboxyl-terminal processing protease